jgi:hypothetical protein
MTELNEGTLSRLPSNVATPPYDRTRIKRGIAHFGVGNFHRALFTRSSSKFIRACPIRLAHWSRTPTNRCGSRWKNSQKSSSPHVGMISPG